jgi:hypothetical protein
MFLPAIRITHHMVGYSSLVRQATKQGLMPTLDCSPSYLMVWPRISHNSSFRRTKALVPNVSDQSQALDGSPSRHFPRT